MANEQNLRPLNKRSKKKARELGRKGGIASGIAKREKADFKKAFMYAMECVNPKQLDEVLTKYGVETKYKIPLIKWIDFLQLKLMTPDAKPADIIKFLEMAKEMLGQTDTQKLEITSPIKITFEKEDKNC